MTEEVLTPEQRWRKHRRRQLLAFVTLPGVLLGTASFATAFSAGLFDKTPPHAVCQPTIVRAPARGSFTINVMNATGESGKATEIGRELKKRDFKIGDISNAPDSLLIRDSAVIYYGHDSSDHALLLQQQIAGSQLFFDGRSGKTVDLVIGLGYKQLVPVPPRFPPLPSAVRVNVFNTTFKPGLAATIAKQLSTRGFKTGKVGNDPDKSFLPSNTAVIRYGPDGDLAAKVLAQHIPGAVLKRVPREGESLDLVIGNLYTALVPTSEVPPPPPQPKKVVPTVARPCKS